MSKPRKISRRRFVQSGVAGSVALSSLALGRLAQAQAAKPNIIFIMADDLGLADVSCHGQRDYTTPNIDQLATEGLRFTQAYSNSAVCTPTRVIGLPPGHPTIPSLLKRAGYATELIGKWEGSARRRISSASSSGSKPTCGQRMYPTFNFRRRSRIC